VAAAAAADAAADAAGPCSGCGLLLWEEAVVLRRVDPHSDAADELLCAACGPGPPGAFTRPSRFNSKAM
jgi:hypothetical protein